MNLRRLVGQPFVLALVLSIAVTLAVQPVASSTAPVPTAAAGPVGPAGPAPTVARQDLPWLQEACGTSSASMICRVTRFPGRPWLVLWGDSHALQYTIPLRRAALQRRFNLVVIFSGGCPLSLPYPAAAGQPRMTCDKHNVRALAYVQRLVDSGRRVRAVLSSWWDFYRKRYALHRRALAAGAPSPLDAYERHIVGLGVDRSRAMFSAIGRLGIRADVIAQSGTPPAGARPCAPGGALRACGHPRRAVLPREAGNRAWLRRLSSSLATRPLVIDPSPAYCTRSRCFGRRHGRTTFSDWAHLHPEVTRSMGRYFRPTIDALLTRR